MWAEVIAAQRNKSEAASSVTAWHHGSPLRAVLDTPDPPFRSGRYHRVGDRPTWYGSSAESGAWAEFVRSLPDGVDPAQFQRRIGKVNFELVVLDLTSSELQHKLEITRADLVADDVAVCEELAAVAAEAGFEALVAPSAAAATETTLAVFGAAIRDGAKEVVDLGVKTPPANPR